MKRNIYFSYIFFITLLCYFINKAFTNMDEKQFLCCCSTKMALLDINIMKLLL